MNKINITSKSNSLLDKNYSKPKAIYGRNNDLQLFKIEKNDTSTPEAGHLQKIINDANYDAVDQPFSEERLIKNWIFKCLDSRLEPELSESINILAKNTASVKYFAKIYPRGFIFSVLIMLIKIKGNAAFCCDGKLNPTIINEFITNLLNKLTPEEEKYRNGLNELLNSSITTSIFNKTSISITGYLKDITFNKKTGSVKFGTSNYANTELQLRNNSLSKNLYIDKDLIYLGQLMSTANSDRDSLLINQKITNYQVNIANVLDADDEEDYCIRTLIDKKKVLDNATRIDELINAPHNNFSITLPTLKMQQISIKKTNIEKKLQTIIIVASKKKLQNFKAKYNLFSDEKNSEKKLDIARSLYTSINNYNNALTSLINDNNLNLDDFKILDSNRQQEYLLTDCFARLIKQLGNFLNFRNFNLSTILNQKIETVSNDGNAGADYKNSCGAISIYDAFKQLNQGVLLYNKNRLQFAHKNRLHFAQEFKDDVYLKSRELLKLSGSINDTDIALSKSPDLERLNKIKLNDICSDLSLTIGSTLAIEQIKLIAQQKIENTNQSNKIVYTHHELNNTFKDFGKLLNFLYGDYTSPWISRVILDKIKSIKTNILYHTQQILKNNNNDVQQYNIDHINKLENENTLSYLNKLYNKINSPNFEIDTLSTEDAFNIFKSMDKTLDPISFYDIEGITDEKIINSKKQAYDGTYKSSTLTVAQLALGLGKYGFVFDQELELPRSNNKLIIYTHISNPELKIILKHMPGHWEAVRYSSLGVLANDTKTINSRIEENIAQDNQAVTIIQDAFRESKTYTQDEIILIKNKLYKLEGKLKEEMENLIMKEMSDSRFSNPKTISLHSEKNYYNLWINTLISEKNICSSLVEFIENNQILHTNSIWSSRFKKTNFNLDMNMITEVENWKIYNKVDGCEIQLMSKSNFFALPNKKDGDTSFDETTYTLYRYSSGKIEQYQKQKREDLTHFISKLNAKQRIKHDELCTLFKGYTHTNNEPKLNNPNVAKDNLNRIDRYNVSHSLIGDTYFITEFYKQNPNRPSNRES